MSSHHQKAQLCIMIIILCSSSGCSFSVTKLSQIIPDKKEPRNQPSPIKHVSDSSYEHIGSQSTNISLRKKKKSKINKRISKQSNLPFNEFIPHPNLGIGRLHFLQNGKLGDWTGYTFLKWGTWGLDRLHFYGLTI